jgi:uncharacterized protein YcbK (DUF882 family)
VIAPTQGSMNLNCINACVLPNSLQVDAVDHHTENPLPNVSSLVTPERNFSSRLSTTSSRRETTTARNEAARLARESNARLDEDQAFLEATEIAKVAQAKFDGVKRRKEIERQRFEIQVIN